MVGTGDWGAEEVVDSNCRENSLHMNCLQNKAPSPTFFPNSQVHSDHFLVDLKHKLWKRSYQSMKNNPAPDLFQNNQEGIKCIHARVCTNTQTNTHTHTHTHTHTPTHPNHAVSSEAVNYTEWSLELHLLIFHSSYLWM